MKAPAASSSEIEYPSSDGQPMAENDWQRWAMIDAITVLRTHFADRPAYAGGDLLIYYEEGNPHARVAPDVFVVLGAPKHLRMNYKLWEEPGPPDFVLEIVASAGTCREALGQKRALYARIGVREYWQFDPTGRYLAPPLQGLRLHRGDYRPLPGRLEAGTRVLHSDALGLDMCVEKRKLRFFDPASGEYLLTYDELTDAILDIRTRDGEFHGGRAPSSVTIRGGYLPTHAELAEILRDLRARDATLKVAHPSLLDRARYSAWEEHDGRLAEAAARKAAEARIAELEALVRELQDGRSPSELAQQAEPREE